MMNYAEEQVASLVNMPKREAFTQFVNLGLIITSALIMWKFLILFTGSESPVVVVLSGSMEPGFYRGDILFLHMGRAPVRAGEVVVFSIEGQKIPIVHRSIKVHERRDALVPHHTNILTKGDNNDRDDRSLYSDSQSWLNRRHIMGRVVGYVPYIGMVTIIMNDYPYAKYALISILGLFVVTTKD